MIVDNVVDFVEKVPIDTRLRVRINKTLKKLNQLYPAAKCSLNFTTPLELLFATIMSAQTTDIRVNHVTVDLFNKYASVEDYATADSEEIASLIKTVGCYKNKAKNIVKTAQIICKKYDKKVPQTMEDLVTLPGVGRKTANVVLSNAFCVPGFAVDTHVKRVAFRLGWTDQHNPENIEKELCTLIDQKNWCHSSHLLIFHGRHCCKARNPNCGVCEVSKLCCKNI